MMKGYDPHGPTTIGDLILYDVVPLMRIEDFGHAYQAADFTEIKE